MLYIQVYIYIFREYIRKEWTWYKLEERVGSSFELETEAYVGVSWNREWIPVPGWGN